MARGSVDLTANAADGGGDEFGIVQLGDVWWAKPDPAVGREQSGRRPVLVVANQWYLDAATTFAMTEQVKAISRKRFVHRLGCVDEECLRNVRAWIVDYL